MQNFVNYFIDPLIYLQTVIKEIYENKEAFQISLRDIPYDKMHSLSALLKLEVNKCLKRADVQNLLGTTLNFGFFSNIVQNSF